MINIKVNTVTRTFTVKKITRKYTVNHVGKRGLPGDSANITVGTTTTLPAGSQATVINIGTESDAIFDFGIPRGENGASSNLVQSVNGKQGDVVLDKSDIGLSNVDNTSDTAKPISTATQTALNAKYDASNPAGYITSAPVQSVAGKTGVVTLNKSDVGLSNVDNTADANKPISTAVQTALNGKANTVHTHTASQISDSTTVGRNVLTATDAAAARTAIGAGTSNLVIGTTSTTAKAGDYTPTKSDVGLGNVDNTSDLNKPVSTATQTSLNGKENSFSKGSLVAGTNVSLTGTTANRLVGSGDITISTTGGSTVSDATTSSKGIVQLAGDLGGVGTTASAPVLKNTFRVFNFEDYGATGDGTTDDSVAVQNTINAAAAVRGIATGKAGVYVVTNISIPALTKLQSRGADLYRFAGTGAESALMFKQKSGATTPVVTINGPGVTVESLTINVNGSSQTGLVVSDGFESRLNKVRIYNGTGIGIDVRSACNTAWYDVFIDNTNVGMRVAPVSPKTVNTLDITGLTIERCSSTFLDLGPNTDGNTAEFIRISKLHAEAATDNGGVPNTVPMIHFKNARSVTLVDPFIFGGTAPLIQVETDTAIYPDALNNLTIIGGTLLGQNSGTGNMPTRLVRLVSGDLFTMLGVKLDNSSANPVLIESTYGMRAYASLTNFRTNRAGTAIVTDNRTTKTPDTTENSFAAAGATFSKFTNTSGYWIDIPVDGPAGIGDGGVGVNTWIARAAGTGQFFNSANAGDLIIRPKTGGKTMLGTVNGTSEGTVYVDGTTLNMMGHNIKAMPDPVDDFDAVNKNYTEARLATKEGTVATGTTAQYYRGDKSWQTLNKSAVGLANVDNTSDANKPVSTAQQTALNAKYDASNPSNYVNAAGASAAAPVQSVAGKTGTVTLAKGDVGLGNVDNTPDTDKPISTATQTALDGKQATGDYATNTALNTGLAGKVSQSTNNGTNLVYTRLLGVEGTVPVSMAGSANTIARRTATGEITVATASSSDSAVTKAQLDTKQDSITLTTTGTSGAATLIGSTLNIPQYTGGGGGGGSTFSLESIRTVQPSSFLGNDSAPQQTYAHLVTVGGATKVDRMSVLVTDYSGTPSTVQMGIYSSAGTLLTSGTVNVTAVGLATASMTEATLTAGNNYYLAIVNQNNDTGTKFPWGNNAGNNVNQSRIVAGTTTLASTLGAGSATGRTFALTAWSSLATAAITGTGDVSGPASSTDTGIATYNGTTGKVIQSSGITINSSTNWMTIPDGVNIVLGTGTGTVFGTSPTQKISFLGGTPVARQSATAELGTVLSAFNLRTAGSGYPISTSGTINSSGQLVVAGVRTAVRTVTAATTITTTDYTVFANTTTAGFTITLPTAVSVAGRIYEIKKISTDTNTLTIATTSSQTIDGSTTLTTSATTRPSWTFKSDGSNWWLM